MYINNINNQIKILIISKYTITHHQYIWITICNFKALLSSYNQKGSSRHMNFFFDQTILALILNMFTLH